MTLNAYNIGPFRPSMTMMAAAVLFAGAATSPPRVVILGLGYTGSAICRLLSTELSCTVAGSCRTETAALTARKLLGVPTFVLGADGVCADGRDALARATHVLSTIAPVDGSDPILSHLSGAPNARWLGYLSTTSVYGDHQGAWVDENAPTRAPAGSASHARLSVEAAWRAREVSANSPRVCVFRLAGIYGPGRSALDTLRRDGAGVELADGAATSPGNPVSRVHVDDIAGAVLAALRAEASGVFNVADHDPAPRGAVMRYAATLLSPRDPPGPAAADVTGRLESERTRRRGVESKRVCGDKLRLELGYRFRYPDYVSGLAAIARA